MKACAGLRVLESDEEEGEVGLGRCTAVRVDIDASDEVAVAVLQIRDGELLRVRLVVQIPTENDAGGKRSVS